MRQPVSPAVAWILALAGASAVAFGAFGAHALRGTLDARGLELWKTAVDYHFWHALAFGLAALVPLDGRARRIALSAFAIGIVLFSGSLYALALGAPHWTGIVTPFGGVAFIVGWLALGLAMLRREA
jgi:uncharacterized membrane protein YgdD (TMEM256/DUF423 family)